MTAPQPVPPSADALAALALLRQVRAAAESGVKPKQVLVSATAEAPPKEAALAELLRIVSASYPATGIDLLCETGLAGRLLPEVERLRQMPVAGVRHKDVYRHTLLVVMHTAPDPTLRMAALLHDIGKPATMRVDGGSVAFPGHAEVGAEMARRRLRRLGAARELSEAVMLLVALHLRANSYEDSWTDSAVRRLDREAGEQLERLLALSRADVTSARREAVERALRRVDALEARIAAVRTQDVKPESPLDGHALMTLFARPPGRWIGVIKDRLEAMVEAGELAANDVERATAIAQELLTEAKIADAL